MPILSRFLDPDPFGTPGSLHILAGYLIKQQFNNLVAVGLKENPHFSRS